MDCIIFACRPGPSLRFCLCRQMQRFSRPSALTREKKFARRKSFARVPYARMVWTVRRLLFVQTRSRHSFLPVCGEENRPREPELQKGRRRAPSPATTTAANLGPLFFSLPPLFVLFVPAGRLARRVGVLDEGQGAGAERITTTRRASQKLSSWYCTKISVFPFVCLPFCLSAWTCVFFFSPSSSLSVCPSFESSRLLSSARAVVFICQQESRLFFLLRLHLKKTCFFPVSRTQLNRLISSCPSSSSTSAFWAFFSFSLSSS